MEKGQNALISILVPVYGVEKYIERCAISLFEQTYDNIEYIFVNDCTPDNSWSILGDVISKYLARKSRILLPTHDKNRGSAVVRNTAVNLAKGDFILWVDADDYVDVNMVKKVVECQKQTNADIVCFNAKVLYSKHSEFILNKDYKNNEDLTIKLLLGTAPHQLWGHLIRRSLYVDNDIHAIEGVNQAEDFCVLPRLAFFSKKIATLHEALYFYDMTRVDSYTNNFSLSSEKQISEAYDFLHAFFDKQQQIYVNALLKGEIESIANRLKKLSFILEDDQSYSKLLFRLNSINKKYWLFVKYYNLPILLLQEKNVVRRYSSFLAKIKSFI